ncbi:DUF1254 domain-containing protein [Lyngbya sp. PCC 8106]|uniref:DUF1254 domain-containing protein n=1 Tax=Lyngbya sp. (strain PCC 8106) TaxID=313612 RepID=UPI0000EA8FFA|nr:DUF1254 domain-containing protein [Lyngbya sp. PCC 8106]EAW35231.1 hypothetical protein L8106_15879 [Lyngbya sp. PCC 8106]
MAEQTPKYIETRTIESRIGSLEFERGFPTPKAVKTLFEFRTFYRAVEVFTQNTFGVSLYAMRKSLANAGFGKANQVSVWKNRMDSKSILLTANSETVYAMTFLDLKGDGPTVIESPPKALGLINDMWMRYIGDMGMMGPDKGEGGKFLILPPGYEGKIPEGYYVMQSKTYSVWCAIRLNLVDNKPDVANALYKEHLKIYPLSNKDNPEPTELINASGMEIDTVHSENYTYMEELGHLVEQEHPDALPDGQKFLLASIGMEFGKPFQPDAQLKSTLEEAVAVGAAMLRANMWDYVGDDKWIYKDRKWWNPFVGGKYTFDPAGYFNYDAQALFAAYATAVTPAMASKTVGGGSQYLCSHQDKDGNPLNGDKNYQLHIPAGIPAKNFWSLIVYDSASRSMIQVAKPMPTISSYTDPVINEDGSVDLYFGPEAPAGKEKNWIETLPNKGWTGVFRLYGPLESFFDQTWKLNDIEEVK